jgi:hypothetical protein
MSDRNIGQEILAGIQEIKAFKAGKVSLKTIKLKEMTGIRETFHILRSPKNAERLLTAYKRAVKK